jgi:hypothetical protein
MATIVLFVFVAWLVNLGSVVAKAMAGKVYRATTLEEMWLRIALFCDRLFARLAFDVEARVNAMKRQPRPSKSWAQSNTFAKRMDFLEDLVEWALPIYGEDYAFLDEEDSQEDSDFGWHDPELYSLIILVIVTDDYAEDYAKAREDMYDAMEEEGADLWLVPELYEIARERQKVMGYDKSVAELLGF